MKINEPYYSQITDGLKTVEGRVLKGKWKHVKVGSYFICYPPSEKKDKSEYCLISVIKIHKCKNFKDLYTLCGDKLLPDVEEAEPWKIYNKWFPKEMVERNGVVGLEFRIVFINGYVEE